MPEPTEVRPGFGPWLARVRRQHGLSQREFADALGVGERTVRAWEAGEIRPSARSLRLIARGTGMSIVRLLDVSPTA